MLQSALKTNMTPVPYKGTAPAMTDLIGGQVDLMCEQATNAVPQIEGKKVKVYGDHQPAAAAAAGAQGRADAVGIRPARTSTSRSGTACTRRRGTPPAVLAKLNAALRTALKDPELIKREEALGLTVVTDERLDPAGHRKFLEAEKVRWSKVIKDAGEYAD